MSLRSDPESCSSPAEPSSPRGVASLIGTLSTLDSASHDSHSRALAAAAQDAPSPGAHSAPAGHTVLSELSGIVQLDGSAAQPLLGAGGHGLRHFYVPQHLAWPDALGQGALAVYLPPGAHEDVQRAALEFVAALPRLSADGVACVTAALPPILRLADLPPDELGDALDALLHLGRTLLLQARGGAGLGTFAGSARARTLLAPAAVLRLPRTLRLPATPNPAPSPCHARTRRLC